jgi:hypothetical protein
MIAMLRTTIAACCLLWLLGGCGRHDNSAANADGSATDDTGLPKPAPAGGSVTGMPAHPGPGQIGAPATGLPSTDSTATNDASNDDAIAGEDASSDVDENPPGGDVQMPEEPTPADAVAVIRDYYRAIDGLDYAHAWSLWSDGGRSSGQSPQQFADGFANTAHVTVQTGQPGDMDAAAGSRFIEVPVTITAEMRGGGTQQYTGTYTLRRAVVDGATPEQRAWRIASASLHAISP